MLERTTERVGRMDDASFVRAYSSFAAASLSATGKPRNSDSIASTHAALGFAYDEIVTAEAISEAGDNGVENRYLWGSGMKAFSSATAGTRRRRRVGRVTLAWMT
jgi:hypothetical protein